MKKKRTRATKKKFDPVCGMNVSGFKGNGHLSHKGVKYHFCDKTCRARFSHDPEKHLKTPIISLKNVYKTFTIGTVQTKVLQGLDVNIWEGDFVAIIGPSGSGKSTMLNMMGLLDRPNSGKIMVHGKDVAHLNDEERAQLRSQTFGFVFQQYNLIPWLTAYENITLPLLFSGKENNEKKLRAQIKEIGLAERITHRPYEMSGGEQQRVALLRALSNDPLIILGDEPTGNLDSHTGAKLLDMLIKLHKKEKKTLIIVTHDRDIAAKADLILSIKDGVQIPEHHLNS